MASLHGTLHVRPSEVQPGGQSVTIGDLTLPTLETTVATRAVPFAVSFEQAVVCLARLPRMFVELDGSFVWVSSRADAEITPWQLDGVLYDREGTLMHVELKGRCPPDELDQLLRCLGWPHTAVMFQHAASGAFLSEATLRQAWALSRLD